MIEQEELELNFYKNGTAEDVLKRFVFSQEEEKLVRDAIRTSKMQKPRMVLIQKADELLREIAKTRNPIEPTHKTDLSTETLMNMEMANFKKEKIPETKPIPFFYIPKTKWGRIIYFSMIGGIILLQFFMYNDAQRQYDIFNQQNQEQVERLNNIINGVKE